MADAAPIALDAADAAPLRARWRGGPHGRLRLVLHLAFAVLALALLVQGWHMLRLEEQRSADAEIVDRAGVQRTQTQQVGRLAALVVAEPAARATHARALETLLRQAGADALALERLIQQRRGDGTQAGDEMPAAIAAWQAARGRLWTRADALLRLAPPAAVGDDAELPRAARAVQAEVAPALAAAQRLSAAVRDVAAGRAGVQRQALQLGLLAALALLVLLSLTVVEPGARAVRRQTRQLQQQATELQRLTRAAEHDAVLVDKLQALWKALPIGVVVLDAGGQIVEANRVAERLLGLTQAQLQGSALDRADWRIVREDGAPYDPDQFPASRTLRTGAALANEVMGVHTPQGELRWLVVNTEPLRGADGQVQGVVACFGDATEMRRLHESLSSNARTDALTRLPNRAVVMERLERAIDHARRHPGYGFAVLFMDFDRFKQVNDTLGHGAGDELLRQVAERLRLALRPGDAVAWFDDESRVAARIGGDEFVVVLEGVHDEAVVGTIAERLLAELAEPYLLGTTPVQSSVSLGVVLARGGDTTADKVLRDADTAMYEAKRAGRGRWVMFDDSMHERVARAVELENDLRRALRDEELFVIYQPVVDLATRAPVGVEALVRWRHPTRGLVPPADFIGIAEESGLIDAVGSFVMHSACEQFVRWRRELGARAPRYLSVNLSRAQLQRGDLVAEVAALLQETALHPAQLQFEITESLAAQDETVQATLRALKALGVKLALDDFGTGYSSLACLHQLPVDTVKIDRSFVRHAETVEVHRVLIEATIRVARTLGMTTVAEGIECDGQAALMLALECDRGQGFLYSRPLPAAELEAWLRRGAVAETLD